MPSIAEGFVSTLFFRVAEEVLQTQFHFVGVGSTSPQLGTRHLTDALATLIPTQLEWMGNDAALECIVVRPLGYGYGWRYELPVELSGQGESEAISEIQHVRLSIVSQSVDGKRQINRNQIPGLKSFGVEDGRVTTAASNQLLALITALTDGSVTAGGSTFQLSCVTHLPDGSFEFRIAERWSVKSFLGTRIDRVRNRPNTGRKLITEDSIVAEIARLEARLLLLTSE